MNKRIGINLLPYGNMSHGGAEVYLTSLARSLQENYPEFDLVLIGSPEILKQFPDDVFLKIPVQNKFVEKSRLGRIFFEHFFLGHILSGYRLDCLISNYVSPFLCDCPRITVVHDLLLRRYPETLEKSKYWYWSVSVPFSITLSKSVVTVSEFSANEIRSCYPEAARKTFVTVEGINPALISVPVDTGEATNQRIVICVATFGKHKNIEALIKAISILPSGFEDIHLVLVGAARTPDAKAHMARVELLVEGLHLAEKVTFAGHISNEALSKYYRTAELLVLPSLYEGFGLPIIEAQYFDCPVICSNRASLPEIAGNGACVVDPTPELIRDAIVKIINTPQLRQELIAEGRKNVQKYSWDIAAGQMMKAVEYATSTASNHGDSQ